MERRFVAPEAETWEMWLQATKWWLSTEPQKYPERVAVKVLKDRTLSAAWGQEASNMVGQQMSVRHLQHVGLLSGRIAKDATQRKLVNLKYEILWRTIWFYLIFNWELHNLFWSKSILLPPPNFMWLLFLFKPRVHSMLPVDAWM